MRPIHYAAIFTWAVAAALWAGKLEEHQLIMFDPLRDGPIYFEPIREGVARLHAGTCLTSISTGPGTGTAVYSPCSTSVTTIGSTSTSNILITPTTGGTHVAR